MDFSIVSERFMPVQTKLLSFQENDKSFEYVFCFSYFNKISNQFIQQPDYYWLFFETKSDFTRFVKFELPLYLLNNLDYHAIPSDNEGNFDFDEFDVYLVEDLLKDHFSIIDSFIAFEEEQEELINFGFDNSFVELIKLYDRLSSPKNENLRGKLKSVWMGSIKQLQLEYSSFETEIAGLYKNKLFTNQSQFKDGMYELKNHVFSDLTYLLSMSDNLVSDLLLLNSLNIQYQHLYHYNSMPFETIMDLTEDEKSEFKSDMVIQLDNLKEILIQTNNTFILDKFNALIKETTTNFL
jgi:hypothetical protein